VVQNSRRTTLPFDGFVGELFAGGVMALNAGRALVLGSGERGKDLRGAKCRKVIRAERRVRAVMRGM